MGGLVLRLQCACFVYFYTVLRQSVLVSATVTAVSDPSVSAVVSVTAITAIQIRRIRPKPEKVVSVGLYNHPTSQPTNNELTKQQARPITKPPGGSNDLIYHLSVIQ